MSKLKIGLLLDDYEVPAWAKVMFQEIREGDYAEIVLVVLNDSATQGTRNSPWQRLRKSYRRVPAALGRRGFAMIYRTLIERRLRLPDATAPTDARSLLGDIPAIQVRPVKKGTSDYFQKDDVETIRKYNLDVLYRGGFGILRGEILKAARYGVWSFHHGDNRINRGGPAGFWETMENWPATGSILQILTEDLDNGTVLYRSSSCTDDMSVTDNRSKYYWKTLSFLPRKLRELHEVGEDAFFSNVDNQNQHPEFYSRRLYTEPSTRELAVLTARKLREKSARLIRDRLSFEQWIIMFHLSERFSSSLWRYKPIIPPPDRFWADPHIIHKDGNYYIFIEEYLYHSGTGHIALIVMDSEGNYTEPELLIKRPYHMSYPFVFEYQGDYYMIPETQKNHTIELYKSMDFPRQWEFQRNLMENINAVDSTLLFYQDRWWLFANIVETPGASSWDELYLFSADNPVSGSWVSHPRNPVISDCETARPAGRIFSMNGELYRPSQNCTHKYGYGFNINRIMRLDADKYAESLVSRVAPDWNSRITGTHTFNRAGSLHVIDALYRRGRLHWRPAR